MSHWYDSMVMTLIMTHFWFLLYPCLAHILYRVLSVKDALFSLSLSLSFFSSSILLFCPLVTIRDSGGRFTCGGGVLTGSIVAVRQCGILRISGGRAIRSYHSEDLSPDRDGTSDRW